MEKQKGIDTSLMKTTTCKPLEKLFQVFYWDCSTSEDYCWIIKAENKEAAGKIAEIFAEENGIIGGAADGGGIKPVEIDLICLNTYDPEYPETLKKIRE